jgi:hypothetical protein
MAFMGLNPVHRDPWSFLRFSRNPAYRINRIPEAGDALAPENQQGIVSKPLA